MVGRKLTTDLFQILSKNTKSMIEMKKEILMLQRDLLQERTKVKSLTTELENPLNVHRWRKLTGRVTNALSLCRRLTIRYHLLRL